MATGIKSTRVHQGTPPCTLLTSPNGYLTPTIQLVLADVRVVCAWDGNVTRKDDEGKGKRGRGEERIPSALDQRQILEIQILRVLVDLHDFVWQKRWLECW